MHSLWETASSPEPGHFYKSKKPAQMEMFWPKEGIFCKKRMYGSPNIKVNYIYTYIYLMVTDCTLMIDHSKLQLLT
jgi:hypothetical protein